MTRTIVVACPTMSALAAAIARVREVSCIDPSTPVIGVPSSFETPLAARRHALRAIVDASLLVLAGQWHLDRTCLALTYVAAQLEIPRISVNDEISLRRWSKGEIVATPPLELIHIPGAISTTPKEAP